MILKKSAYIITKPLQYINSTNIPDNNIKDCFIIDSFKNSYAFYRKVNKYSTYWSRIFFKKNKINALLCILSKSNKYDKIYLDSDFGISIRIILLLFPYGKIFVYEEGYGTYRSNNRINKNFKDKIFIYLDKFFGQNYIGGCIKTKGIYVYHPNVFIKFVSINTSKSIYKFQKSFFEHLSTFKEIKYIFPMEFMDDIVEKNVIVYLSSWDINYYYKTIISQYNSYFKILKLHPHIKSEFEFKNDFNFIVDNYIPAEVLILKILEHASSLILIHQNSSSIMYFPDSAKIQEVNIDKNKDLMYSSIIDLIKRDCNTIYDSN